MWARSKPKGERCPYKWEANIPVYRQDEVAKDIEMREALPGFIAHRK